MQGIRRSGRVASLLVCALLLGACGDANSDPGSSLRVERVEPLTGDMRGPVSVRFEGAGLAMAAARFGDVDGSIVERSDRALVVSVPGPGRPARVPVVVRAEGKTVALEELFVFRAMPPEALRFVPVRAPAVSAQLVRQGDVDGDGRPDLVVLGGGALVLLSGNDFMRDELARTPADGTTLALARLAGGADTIVLATANVLELVRLVDGALVRETVPDALPMAVAVRPAADGLDDLLVAVRGESGHVVARVVVGEQGLVTTPVLELGAFAVVSLAFADLDGDGADDLVLGGKDAGPRVLHADGHGGWRDAAPGTLPASVAGAVRVADLDVDGRADLVVAGANGDRAWLNQGGRFVDRTAATFGPDAAPAAFEADLDGDAAVDRVGASPALTLLRNDGTGRFFDYSLRAAPRSRHVRPLLAADLDGDGDDDLVGADAGGALSFLENWAPRPFVDPDLDGVPTGRDVCPDTADPAQADRDAHPFSCTDAACRAEPGCRFSQVDGRSYLACSTAVPFAQARAFCASRGARLALGETEAEAAAIAAAAGARAWIDLDDLSEEGVFRTSAGTEPPFTAWAEGEPNDGGGLEDCAETNASGSWNDLPCDHLLAFVCEEPFPRTSDGRGDACDTCPLLPAADQLDTDEDGTGDACEAAP